MAFVDPSPRNLAGLDPAFRSRVIVMVNWIRGQGVPLIVISGRRSVAKQNQLIAAGRTTATRSRHLVGKAVDVQWAGFSVAQVPRPWWDWIGSVGEAVGLMWGGRFRGNVDLNHFQVR